MRVPAFWDSSALVPLCVSQSTTGHAIALYRTHEVVVWWAAPVEIVSALARLMRLQQIIPADYATARKLANLLSDSWSLVQPSEVMRGAALQLVDRYDLRAADALQLAAALEWCENAPRGRVFLSAGQRLREAALLVGFNGPLL